MPIFELVKTLGTLILLSTAIHCTAQFQFTKSIKAQTNLYSIGVCGSKESVYCALYPRSIIQLSTDLQLDFELQDYKTLLCHYSKKGDLNKYVVLKNTGLVFQGYKGMIEYHKGSVYLLLNTTKGRVIHIDSDSITSTHDGYLLLKLSAKDLKYQAHYPIGQRHRHRFLDFIKTDTSLYLAHYSRDTISWPGHFEDVSAPFSLFKISPEAGIEHLFTRSFEEPLLDDDMVESHLNMGISTVANRRGFRVYQLKLSEKTIYKTNLFQIEDASEINGASSIENGSLLLSTHSLQQIKVNGISLGKPENGKVTGKGLTYIGPNQVEFTNTTQVAAHPWGFLEAYNNSFYGCEDFITDFTIKDSGIDSSNTEFPGNHANYAFYRIDSANEIRHLEKINLGRDLHPEYLYPINRNEFIIYGYNNYQLYDIPSSSLDTNIRWASVGCFFHYIRLKDIEVEDTTRFTFIPNAFSPNNDGINDQWVVSPAVADRFIVRIFASDGSLVHYQTGYKPLWNGKKNNSTLPAGVYFYIVENTRTSEVHNGKIHLLR